MEVHACAVPQVKVPVAGEATLFPREGPKSVRLLGPASWVGENLVGREWGRFQNREF